MQVCIKGPLYTLAFFVIVLELPGGRSCKFFNENFLFRLLAFLTNFRRIDFRINLFIDARSRVLSNLVIIFLIWRPVSEIRGTKKILGPPCYLPNFWFSAPKIFFARTRPRRHPSSQNFTFLSLTGGPREPVKFSNFWIVPNLPKNIGKMCYS